MSEAAVPAPGPLERRRGSLTDEARATFLEAIAEVYSVRHAAKLAGLHHSTLYAARKADADFAAAWDEAIEQGTQLLEDELRRRALEGWTEDTLDGDGRLVRRVQRIHPQDLHFQLKARRPEVYRDNTQVTVGDRVTFSVEQHVERRNVAIDRANAVLDEYLASPEMQAQFEMRRRAIAAIVDRGGTRPTSQVGDVFALADQLGYGAASLRRTRVGVDPRETVDGEVLAEIEAGDAPADNEPEGSS